MIKETYLRLRTRPVAKFARRIVAPLLRFSLLCLFVLLAVMLLPFAFIAALFHRIPRKQYDQAQLENVGCNYCGSNARKVIHDFSPLLIVRCKKCGLVYTSPRLKLAAIEGNLYGEEFFKGYEVGYENPDNAASLHGFFDRWLNSLAQHIDRPVWRICELGPGLGGFLNVAKQRGHDVYGIELSEYAINYARTHFGIETIYRGTVDAIDTIDLPKLDVVVMFASIEHLHDPLGVLQKISSRLSDDGLLLIGTGVWGCFNQFVAREAWGIIAPEGHLFYFSKRTMRTLLEKGGFLPLSLETNGALINELTANRLLVWLFNNRITSYIGLPSFVQQRKLGDEMWIISRKADVANQGLKLNGPEVEYWKL